MDDFGIHVHTATEMGWDIANSAGLDPRDPVLHRLSPAELRHPFFRGEHNTGALYILKDLDWHDAYAQAQEKHLFPAMGFTPSWPARRRAFEQRKREAREIRDAFPGVDILLMPALRKLTPHQLQEVVIHEYWHFLEDEQGVYPIAPFINEGTASYIEKSYHASKTENIPYLTPDSCKTADHFHYFAAMRVAEEYLNARSLPCAALLQPKHRMAIQDNLLEKTYKFIHAARKKGFTERKLRSIIF